MISEGAEPHVFNWEEWQPVYTCHLVDTSAVYIQYSYVWWATYIINIQGIFKRLF